jgi:hypothetical protein
MTGERSEKGHFSPGNKLGKGRPKGSPNKPLRVFPADEPRSPVASRFRGLLADIIVDLGGEDMMSAGEMQLAKRCAWVSVQCEIMERKPPETFNVTAYATLMGHLTRTLSLLGLKRVPKDVTPTLRDYLKAVRQPDASEILDEPTDG